MCAYYLLRQSRIKIFNTIHSTQKHGCFEQLNCTYTSRLSGSKAGCLVVWFKNNCSLQVQAVQECV